MQMWAVDNAEMCSRSCISFIIVLNFGGGFSPYMFVAVMESMPEIELFCFLSGPSSGRNNKR